MHKIKERSFCELKIGKMQIKPFYTRYTASMFDADAADFRLPCKKVID